MPGRLARRTALLLLAALLSAGRAGAAEPAADEFFEREVRPVLVERCLSCHGDKKTKGDLQLNSRAAVLKGGGRGPAVVPGKPDDSLLVRALRHDAAPRMPPDGKLPAREIDVLTRWVALGAPWPQATPTLTAGGDFTITEEQRRFWSFQPVRAVPPPAVKDADWSGSPIDRFLQARREEKGVAAVGLADRRALIRRATFDLVGLPPTPDEVEAFVADGSPGAFAKVVDRLLASPGYGERWGRHWLDVVHYADTAGETADFPVPEAYRYRNYVIAAFNADKPYDEFVREQVAGDLLAGEGPRDRYAERLVATGFLAGARRFGFDPQNYQHLTIEDTIDVLGKSVLGLTVACARCHDHKFDPISRADYYALYGILDSTRYPFPGSEENKKAHDFPTLLPAAEVALLPKPADAETAYAVAEGAGHDVRVQLRGDPRNPGAEAPRRFLQVLGGQALPAGEKGSGRRQLADWLTDSRNPLFARVMVNRVWQYHFGQGLVRTPNNFGKQGRLPTHPELLDWLADTFVASGWSVKSLHRTILLSRTYQLASADDPRARERDPDDELLWDFPRRRLDAEAIRDSLLFVSGTLDRSPGGPHPFPAAATWNFTQHTPFQAVYETDRRSVYLMQQRLRRHPFLALFDGPDPNASTAERPVTTVPTQALFFLNNPFVHAQSERFAARLLRSAPADAQRIDLALALAYGRAATPEEVRDAQAFLTRYTRELEAAGVPVEKRPAAAWAGYARVLFAANEFIYPD
jgi:hypothetical protein